MIKQVGVWCGSGGVCCQNSAIKIFSVIYCNYIIKLRETGDQTPGIRL